MKRRSCYVVEYLRIQDVAKGDLRPLAIEIVLDDDDSDTSELRLDIERFLGDCERIVGIYFRGYVYDANQKEFKGERVG